MSNAPSPAVERGAEGLAPVEAATETLVALRRGEDPDPYLSALAAYDESDLRPLRADRDRALAFWVNLYNAGTQLLLERREGLYDSPLRFLRFFRADAVTVAGHGLSLDEIEQGILRGCRSKYGFGYLPRFPRSFERRYAIDPDPRVHFALNCGAESCPAIRAYDPDAIDDQLDMATGSYLQGTVEYDPQADRVRLPQLFLWYYGDFGGHGGIRRLLREHGVVPADASPALRFSSWNWAKAKGKYADPDGSE